MLHRPIEHCYWVIPGQFLAGEYPRNLDEASPPEKSNALLKAGITTFIDLTGENEGLLPYVHLLKRASHQRFWIPDFSVPTSPVDMVMILDAIDAGIERRDKVYLHCWGGVGRTGTVVGCWLARHGYQGAAALTQLRELWQQNPKSACRNSPETKEQEQYIVHWTEQSAIVQE